MAQARKKKASKRRPSGSRSSGITRHCFGFLLSGAVLGVLATLLFQGITSDSEQGMGSGFRDIAKRSRESAEREADQRQAPEPVMVHEEQARNKPKFDFYTVLPEIEEVLPKGVDEPIASKPVTVAKAKPSAVPVEDASVVIKRADDKISKPGEVPVVNLSPSYMLQVASYSNPADAEGLKAKLALSGMHARIEKVTISGKGTFHRVRLGPYADYGNLTSADYKLSNMGYKAMRLKVRRGG